MKTRTTEKAAETPLTQDVIYAVRYWMYRLRQRIDGRMGLIATTVLVVGLGFAFSWSWLVAIGIAPILLAVLPCAAMCAVGLCMNKGVGRSCSGTKDTDPASNRQETPPLQIAANADPRFDVSRNSPPLDGSTITNDDPVTALGEPQTLKERN